MWCDYVAVNTDFKCGNRVPCKNHDYKAIKSDSVLFEKKWHKLCTKRMCYLYAKNVSLHEENVFSILININAVHYI